MREIKFRAWDTGIKKMTYDNFVVDAKGKLSFHWQPDMFNSTRSILMQYTGLKDKNGKDAYHKDICKSFIETGGISERKSGYMYGVVEWARNKFIIVPFKYEGGIISVFGDNTIYGFLEDEFTYPFEIIGNIYENPDLLK